MCVSLDFIRYILLGILLPLTAGKMRASHIEREFIALERAKKEDSGQICEIL